MNTVHYICEKYRGRRIYVHRRFLYPYEMFEIIRRCMDENCSRDGYLAVSDKDFVGLVDRELYLNEKAIFVRMDRDYYSVKSMIIVEYDQQRRDMANAKDMADIDMTSKVMEVLKGI